MPQTTFSRRHFFFGSLLAGAVPQAGFGSAPSLGRLGYKSPNEKLNIAGIGAGGRNYVNLVGSQAGVENIVALADADWTRGAQGFEKWPKAAKYKDFRQMLDKHGKEIDAVAIGIPDHMHAICAMACMQLGKHVYLEKPLTRTAWEASLLARAAEKYKVATQMGNQGYSHEATRVACEIIWSGEIGDVTEVHAWHGMPGWPQGMQQVPRPAAVPDTLDWDVWLGGAPWREFTAGDDEYKSWVAANEGKSFGKGGSEFGFYLPFNWRGFFDFGSGLFGDWGVHVLGPANWGLQLTPESLLSVEAVKKEGAGPFTYPLKNAVKYEFAARGKFPPVTVYWSDSVQGEGYLPPGMTSEEARRIPNTGPQVGALPRSGGRYNCIFTGSKGYLGTSGRGENVGLLPGSRWAEYKLPQPYLTRSPGADANHHAAHCRDWVRASKGGSPACSNFSVAGPFTEWLVLGAVATHFEGKLLWDPAKMEFKNNKDATRWIKPTYRKGWGIQL